MKGGFQRGGGDIKERNDCENEFMPGLEDTGHPNDEVESQKSTTP